MKTLITTFAFVSVLGFGIANAQVALSLSSVNTVSTDISATPQESTVLSTVLSGGTPSYKNFQSELSVAVKLMRYKKLTVSDVRYLLTRNRKLSEVIQYFSNNILAASAVSL